MRVQSEGQRIVSNARTAVHPVCYQRENKVTGMRASFCPRDNSPRRREITLGMTKRMTEIYCRMAVLLGDLTTSIDYEYGETSVVCLNAPDSARSLHHKVR